MIWKLDTCKKVQELFPKGVHAKIPLWMSLCKIIVIFLQLHHHNASITELIHQSDPIVIECIRVEYCDKLRIHSPNIIKSVPLHLLEEIDSNTIHGFLSGIKSHFLNMYQAESSISTAISVTTILDNEMYIWSSNENGVIKLISPKLLVTPGIASETAQINSRVYFIWFFPQF